MIEQIKTWLAEARSFQAGGGPAKRLAICQACEFYQPLPSGWCGKCYCGLRLKTALFSAHCPIGKW
jgi:hypothetical protein